MLKNLHRKIVMLLQRELKMAILKKGQSINLNFLGHLCNATALKTSVGVTIEISFVIHIQFLN